MERATGTFKQVGFLCFMMWMSGSQIHLFSIMMLVTGIYQPLSSLFKVREGETPHQLPSQSFVHLSAGAIKRHRAYSPKSNFIEWFMYSMHISLEGMHDSMMCSQKLAPLFGSWYTWKELDQAVLLLQPSHKTRQDSWI